MAKDRGKSKGKIRQENIRVEQNSSILSESLTFSLKYLDYTQPRDNTGTLLSWENKQLLKPLFEKLRALSSLTRNEAVNQKQIKIYGNFPPRNKTDFYHPKFVEQYVSWSVIKGIGGQIPTAAGFIAESTFYIVFLDMNHRFWISEKKGT